MLRLYVPRPGSRPLWAWVCGMHSRKLIFRNPHTVAHWEKCSMGHSLRCMSLILKPAPLFWNPPHILKPPFSILKPPFRFETPFLNPPHILKPPFGFETSFSILNHPTHHLKPPPIMVLNHPFVLNHPTHHFETPPSFETSLPGFEPPHPSFETPPIILKPPFF